MDENDSGQNSKIINNYQKTLLFKITLRYRRIV